MAAVWYSHLLGSVSSRAIERPDSYQVTVGSGSQVAFPGVPEFQDGHRSLPGSSTGRWLR